MEATYRASQLRELQLHWDDPFTFVANCFVAGFDHDNRNTTRPSLSHVPESLSGEKKNKRANGVE